MRERPPGSGRWELRAYVGRDPETGRPQQVSRIFRGGKRDARRALDGLVHDVGRGKHGIGTSATFSKLLDEWMEKVIKKRSARSTIETYMSHIEKYIRPGLGDVRLSKLGAYELDAYFADVSNRGLSAGTMKLQHAIIRAAFSQAERWGWVTSNPAKWSKPALERADAAHSLTEDELNKLYVTAALEDTDMAAAIALGALTGCRRGELCGLQWGDIDWQRGAVRVERQWVPVAGGQHLTRTKTGKPRRVYFGAPGLRILRDYQAAKTTHLGRSPREDGWLLSVDGGTSPLRAKSVTEYITALGRRCGIKATTHSLRHFRETELHHAGIDLPTTASQMGNTVAVMAQTYLHTNDEREAMAGDAVADVMARALTR